MVISNKFDDNDELSAELTGAGLKNGKKIVKATVKKMKVQKDKKKSKLKFKEEHCDRIINVRKTSQKISETVKTNTVAKESMKKAQRKMQQVKNAEKKKNAAVVVKDAAEKTGKMIIQSVSSNKWGILILIILIIVFMLLFTLATSCSSSFVDSGTVYLATTYLSNDEDLIASNNQLNDRENELRDYIEHIPDYYIDWDEYNYYIDDISHDPYQLLSYLSAVKMVFEYDEGIKKKINQVYDSMYHLDIESVHEVRTSTHSEIDSEGNENEVTEEYDYYILNVRLTSKSIEEVVIEELKDEDVYDLYIAMMQTKGNKPNLI